MAGNTSSNLMGEWQLNPTSSLKVVAAIIVLPVLVL
jgi:hypothetical protein